MVRTRVAAHTATTRTVLALAIAAIITPLAVAQVNSQNARFQLSAESAKLELTVNTSRILTLDKPVPKVLVQNTEIIQATPLTANQIQVSALKPGITALNIWDDKDNIQVIDVRVFGDVRELEENLKSLFPQTQLKLRAIQSSLFISGYVPRPETVKSVIEVCEDYFPKVINRVSVGGAQTVLLHVKVVEVSRTKLRRLGVDWAYLNGNDFIVQSVSGLIDAAATQGGALTGTAASNFRFGVIDNASQFGAFINALRQNNLAKILAEPTIVTVSGRAASFNSGGEVPIPVSSGLGATQVQFREFGTTVDFVPLVLGNGMIKLEVRPQITEIDPSLRDATTGTPGFRSRRVDTAVEMRAGQTMALAGLIQARTDTTNVGLPYLADLPWIGAAFRRIEETQNEVELLVMVTPELVSPLDPHEVPRCGPGESTTNPNDTDFYWRGHIEVPRCCVDGTCPNCVGQTLGPVGPTGMAPIYQYEEVAPPRQPPAEPQPQANSQGNHSGYRTQYRAPSAQVPTYNRATADYTPRRNTAPLQPNSMLPNNQRSKPSYANSNPSYTNPSPSYANSNQFYTNDQYVPNSQYKPAVTRQENQYDTNEFEPSLIGPVGYDDLK